MRYTDMAIRHDRKLMVRLVKALLGTLEIKTRGQSKGVGSFPVFTKAGKTGCWFLYSPNARKLLNMTTGSIRSLPRTTPIRRLLYCTGRRSTREDRTFQSLAWHWQTAALTFVMEKHSTPLRVLMPPSDAIARFCWPISYGRFR